MKASLKLPVAVAAMLSLLLVGSPALAHDPHASIGFVCADPSPSTASAHGTVSCEFSLNPSNDFGGTDNDKTDKFEIQLPLDAKLNEKGTHDGADPSDGEKVGQTTITVMDLLYDGCGDNDGNKTYNTNWETTWRAYTPPANWTKVAEYNTVFTVLFVFTENVPSHVIKHDTTGQYAVVTDIPQDRGCAGSTTTFNPLVTYGYAQNSSAQEWVGRNPSTTGNKTVTFIATEVGGTTHTTTDQITIT
jgi:hypothetical protein